MVRMEKTTKEPGGILKWGVRFRSVVLARTECWLTIAAMKMPVDQIGMTLRMALSSSTCFTVDRLHGSSAKPSGVREWVFYQDYGRTLAYLLVSQGWNL
ncbi:LOW QUALITY PROTEIN: hypothetical protein TorRG33x02_035320 [Trema orientale]|uniref:Uncharacterized protein n=1 Tax=Trema orientale TaxID=63057 RepID=A0A2P5FSZ4_TREOI|nr:LOW QUALITY PROTEIN: hypothetical protein TorRG33x02_035320 [Trema orientale]